MPNSSPSSRISVSSGRSPASILPPGNSHSPAILFPSGRWATRTRPSGSISAQAATRRILVPVMRLGPSWSALINLRLSDGGEVAENSQRLLTSSAPIRAIDPDIAFGQVAGPNPRAAFAQPQIDADLNFASLDRRGSRLLVIRGRAFA